MSTKGSEKKRNIEARRSRDSLEGENVEKRRERTKERKRTIEKGRERKRKRRRMKVRGRVRDKQKEPCMGSFLSFILSSHLPPFPPSFPHVGDHL